jgi:hypothetical protein
MKLLGLQYSGVISEYHVAPVQAPAGLPLDGNRSLLQKKVGLLNLCALSETFPITDVALIALAAIDDSNMEVCLPSYSV